MDGALMEIGPYRLKDDKHLVYNEGAWDEFANVLFVDNPVGTGFSYVDTDSYVHELTEMGDQMIRFLEKFFTIFPEYASNDVSRRMNQCMDIYSHWIAISKRRILCWSTHTLYCTGHSRSKFQKRRQRRLEYIGPTDWKWMDITHRAISCIS